MFDAPHEFLAERFVAVGKVGRRRKRHRHQ
jgi:hypothetical protein